MTKLITAYGYMQGDEALAELGTKRGITKLCWALVNVFYNEDCLTPYGAVLRILRLIVDKHKGEGVLIDLNDTQLMGRVFEMVHSRMLPAMESGAISELPMSKSASGL